MSAEEERGVPEDSLGDGPTRRLDADSHDGENGDSDSVRRADSSSSAERRASTRLMETVGAYRIVGLLGRGGMGDVYRGERASGDFSQDVAIKVLRDGANAARIERRFLQERRILARLEHPNIARLVDGGLAEDGRPYYAMEYVDGKPIDAWCDERRLTVDERIDLFIQVCHPVEYAHQNLVVHRDLKPGNILITADGSVKLLDFGIAKVLDESDTLRIQTIDQACLMTPRYASPEQVLRHPITTATDVYALGVVLYELLTGQVPLVSGKGTELEAMQAIVEEDPERPSEVITTHRPPQEGRRERTMDEVATTRSADPIHLSRRLDGDLDAILLKALRKKPDDRYESVAALRHDLERHRLGLPITVRPPDLGYVLGTFVRRNRLLVSAVVLVFATLLAGLASTSWQAREAAVARDAARAEAHRAEAVTEFMAALFQVAGPNQGGDPSMPVREVLERGGAMLDSRLSEQPETRAALLLALGGVYRDLGLYQEAAPLAEQSADVCRRIGDDEGLIEALAVLCDLRIQTARYDDAREILADLDHRVSRDVGDGSSRRAQVLLLSASLQRALGETENAARQLRTAIEALEEDAGTENLEVSAVANSLAVMLHDAGQPGEAATYHQLALGINERLLGPHHPDTLTSMNNLGSVLDTLGEYGRAEALLRRTLELRRQVYPSSHPFIAGTLNLLATTVANQGRYDEAIECNREALRINRELLGDDHPEIGHALNNLAVVHYERGNLEDAEACLREALEVWLPVLGEDHPNVDSARSNLGAVLSQLGRFGEAEVLLEAVLAQRRRQYGDHPRTAIALYNLGRLQLDRGRTEEAERIVRESLDLRREHLGARDATVMLTTNLLAEILATRGTVDEAVSLYREAVATGRDLFPNGHPRTADAQVGLAQLYLAGSVGEYDVAASLRQAIEIRAEAFGEDHPKTIEARRLLAEVGASTVGGE
jgi:serine/threonine protein kinase/Tfp pilus assembly protein PilF